MKPLVQSSKVNFQLHTLGWEAFQDLVNHIIREVLGQTAVQFSHSSDAGQDGAFRGTWKKQKDESVDGPFVIQCKFTNNKEGRLQLSDLSDELRKVKRLIEAQGVKSYLIITNASWTGDSDIEIRKAFLGVGIQHVEIFGEQWITASILSNRKLRAHVPRIYGLGDISQILDERIYAQTEDLLSNWKDNLQTFVPTEAHLKSVHALVEHGFVLLLGEPMAGKTTIAASLAIASADMWECRPIFVNQPDDIKKHWNPDDSKQFFWVDDAFGQTQHSPLATEGWNRTFPIISAAIGKGAKFILTSRTHIHRAARSTLKVSSFPLIANSQVVINVESLTLLEKERILYNHLKLGKQSSEFRKRIKPYLEQIASNAKFFPELAKRLGNPFFTKDLNISAERLKEFIEQPLPFLADIISELDHPSYAALAILFMRAGRVSVPISVSPHEAELLQLIGASIAQTREALDHLEGTLVGKVVDKGEYNWKFRHPTVRDAMSSLVAKEPDYIDVYLQGARIRDILNEVVCGEKKAYGAKVVVPVTRYELLIQRIRELDLETWDESQQLLDFLAFRCPDEVIETWHRADPQTYDRLLQRYRTWCLSLNIITAALYRRNALTQDRRSQVVDSAALDVADSEFDCLGARLRKLFTDEEYDTLKQQVKSVGFPALKHEIESRTDDYDDPDSDPSDHFEGISDKISTLEDLFVEDEEALMALGDLRSSMEDEVGETEEFQKQMLENKRREEQREQDDDRLEREYYETIHGPDAAPPQRDTVSSEVSRIEIQAPPRSIFDDIDK